MRFARFRYVIFLFSALFVLSVASATAQEELSVVQVKSALQKRIDAERQGVGMAAGLISPTGTRIVTHGRSDTSDGAPLNGDTVFEIGSISKVFTTLLLADMTQRGEVRLDDSVSKYLPTRVKTPTVNGHEITLEELATHTSGLPRDPTNLVVRDPENPYADYTVAEMYEFLSGYESPPGAGAVAEYSNLGVGLLGHVLARKAGKTYEELVIERICKPLGMNDTRISLTPSMKRRLAVGHNETLKATRSFDIPTFAGAGALRSTVNDLLKFLDAQMHPEKSPFPAAIADCHRPRVQTKIPGVRVALAWQISNGGDILSHNGRTVGYHSFIGFNRKTGTGLVILSNATNRITDIGLNLLNAKAPAVAKTIDEPPPTAPAPAPAKLAPPSVEISKSLADAYAGDYEVAPGVVISVRSDNARLTAQASGQPTRELAPESETAFRIAEVNGRIVFARNDRGDVTHLTLEQNGQTRTANRIIKPVEIQPEALKDFAGVYQSPPPNNFSFTVSTENGKLTLRSGETAPIEMTPESETTFFAKSSPSIRIVFGRDGQGRVTYFTFRDASGRSVNVRKIQ
jgi:serine-type D-Ala-D-Ala carboxypeptidase/endopeptidase